MTSARRPARGRLAEAAAALPALLGLTCLGAAAIACGPPPAPRTANDADLRSVPEGRALAIAREALADAGFQAGPGFAVDIGREAPLEVDLRVADTRFGVEWVSAQDRADPGDQLPPPAPGGELRILPGVGEDAAIEVLLLHAESYRYDPDRERVQRGATGAADVEARLRRDLRDFLGYCRAQL